MQSMGIVLKKLVFGLLILLGASCGKQDHKKNEPLPKFPLTHKPLVLLVGVDGLGGAYIPDLHMKELEGLMQEGSFTLQAKNYLPPISLPNWMTLISGTSPGQHKIYINQWQGSPKDIPPTLFTKIHKQFPKAKTGFFTYWERLLRLVDLNDVSWADGGSVKAVCKFIEDEHALFAFHYIGYLDHVGHDYGWGSEEYKAQAQVVDKDIGRLKRCVDREAEKRDVLLILTADHGGFEKSHSYDHPKIRAIPIILRGAKVKHAYKIPNELYLSDIASTIEWYLGMPLPLENHLRVIRDIWL